MLPSGSRAKGKSYERKIAEIFRSVFELRPEECCRTPSSGSHPWLSKVDPGDLQFCWTFKKYFPYHVECKNHARVSLAQFLRSDFSKGRLAAWVKQIHSGPDGFTPLLVMRVERENFCAVPSTKFPTEALVGYSHAYFYIGKQQWLLMSFDNFLLVYQSIHGKYVTNNS